MRPVIGILPALDEEDSSLVQANYSRAIFSSGAMPIMLPYTTDKGVIGEFIEICDGFLFAGGCDVEPRRYGEDAREVCGVCSPKRDEVEILAFELIFNTGKPILGICRGCQMINVAMGGALFQDLPTDAPSEVVHRAKSGEPDARHRVSIAPDSPLAKIFGTSATVNSVHHQAIRTLGNGLVSAAYADDGIIEAAYLPGDRFLWCIQWHPERLICHSEENLAIFKKFIRAAGGFFA